jgi:hypothetical protein
MRDMTGAGGEHNIEAQHHKLIMKEKSETDRKISRQHVDAARSIKPVCQP